MNLSQNQLIPIFLLSLLAILASTLILDGSNFYDLLGNFLVIAFFIVLPGYHFSKKIFNFEKVLSNLILGSSLVISFIIPFHALLSYFKISFVLYFLLIIPIFLLIKEKRNIRPFTFNIKTIFIFFFIYLFLSIFLIRQSLYVPVINLDQYLVWPDTYNAIAQTAEITNHGPNIFPFVAGANVPLDYHWGSFSLGSFISFLGNFSIVTSLFRSEFIFVGLLTFSLLFIAGKSIGKSSLAGIFSVFLGGLTLFPTFPEFNGQIGLSRPLISSSSMPQFVSNALLIFSIYLIYNFNLIKNKKLYVIILFFATLSTTLSKGPNGVLILIVTFALLILVRNLSTLKFIFAPAFAGFLIAYFVISSPNTTSGQSGMSLWFNPKNTLDLLIQGNNLTSSTKNIGFFIFLIVLSFIPFIFSILNLGKKNLNLVPLAISASAGILGCFLLETWGYSQFFLLYGAIPILGIFIASSLFYNKENIPIVDLTYLSIGFIFQPILYRLIISFVDVNSSLKLYLGWIISIFIILLIAISHSYMNREKIIRSIVLSTLGIGALTGLSKFDPIAYPQPEHPYSISVGTSEISNYLRNNSNKNDLVATNRHCAGINELQDCTARQFALTALSERRVFIEGWSYTTCPLPEAITNRYWKESDWKLNQEFFIDPKSNWERFKKTGVKWLVVDESRPSIKDYSSIATLTLRSNVVSLWKINEPYSGEIRKPANPCDSKSNY